MPEWSGDGVAPKVDRDQLILDHLPLLKHIAGRMTFDPSGAVDRDDIQGFGMIGLVEAAESWDPTRGLKFSTYAYPRIRGAILDELRRQDFLPRGRRERVRELEATLDAHVKAHGYPPAPEQLAELLDLPLEEVDEILCAAHSAISTSIDGESEVLAAMLTDPRSEDPVGSAEWEEMKQLLVDAISALPEQEKTVITLYYGQELLLREIALVLGVTESRVSQVHSRALYRLNQSFSSIAKGRAA